MFFYYEDVEHGVVVPKEDGSFCSPSPAASLPSGSLLTGSRGCSKGYPPLRSSVPAVLERDTVFHICTWWRPCVAFWEAVVKRDLFIIYLCYLFQDIFQFGLGFFIIFGFVIKCKSHQDGMKSKGRFQNPFYRIFNNFSIICWKFLLRWGEELPLLIPLFLVGL